MNLTSYPAIKKSIHLIAYLLISMLIGAGVTLVLDRIENISVERRIRNDLKQEINAAAASFKKYTKNPTSDEVLSFVKRFSISALSNKIRVINPRAERTLDGKDYTFLFSFQEGDGRIDCFIINSYLKSELDMLDAPEIMGGLLASTLVFTFLVMYHEKSRQTAALHQQVQEQHAEFKKVLEEHEALALLGRMVATLAHEFKTPVATLSNLIQTLPSRLHDEKFITRFLALSKEELERTQQLINNLLVYGKEIELVKREWVSLDDMVAAAASKNGLKLLEKTPPCQIYGDRFYLGLLLDNLMRNSRQAGSRNIGVTVGEDDESSKIISLEDNGKGFPPDVDLDSLFDPFISFHSSGAGLGLYLVRKIALAHNFNISPYRSDRGAGMHLIVPKERIRTHG